MSGVIATEEGWALFDPEAPEEALAEAVLGAFSALYREYFAAEPFINHRLPIELRALRTHGRFRVFLLLTPWHLARLFMPLSAAAEMPLPAGWSAAERAGAPYTVIGPPAALDLLGGRERAHWNYIGALGHFFVQPLIQSMGRFRDAEEAFAAWREVITVRDRNIAERKAKCPWQEEVSRREFFARAVGRGGADSG